jgi:hypothetical protein
VSVAGLWSRRWRAFRDGVRLSVVPVSLRGFWLYAGHRPDWRAPGCRAVAEAVAV